MAIDRSANRKRKPSSTAALTLRLDADSKNIVAKAAALRQISISDYVRRVIVPQARREVESARDRIIVMTPDEQLAFWNALNRPVKLTAAQRRLGTLIRAELRASKR